MKKWIAASLTLAAIVPAALRAQQHPPPPATEPGATLLAIRTLPASSTSVLTITSPSFVAGGDIPFEYTQYKGNVFPGFAWNAGPTGTRSYVVIMQDADALQNNAPILHWTMVNIPASVTTLDTALTTPPTGAMFGPNIRGEHQAYLGPRTPPGPKHRYHVQVFALDTVIPDAAVATYSGLVDAMKGHVLASGELIGLGQAMDK
ncbi:MAG TPA: YbhB/YbcL family Raf kinase inhibitor-like protein [Gemmatimonadaceae bacterium]|nr:YbhB/YbcL family Raf kinase inhibitor-like protein [Gemmatimonadaceae bacterium]